MIIIIILTGWIAEDIYSYLDESHLLSEEQKRCRKRSRGTNSLLFIDRAVLKNAKSHKKNLATGWIDYRKAYRMFHHLWIVECLVLFGIAGAEVLREVEIRRGIFPGDSLSPLSFVRMILNSMGED